MNFSRSMARCMCGHTRREHWSCFSDRPPECFHEESPGAFCACAAYTGKADWVKVFPEDRKKRKVP